MWNPLPFKSLVIPQHNKDILLALVQSHMASSKEPSFDDFVEGKGKGLIILLQYVFQCFRRGSEHDLPPLVVNLGSERH